MEPAVLSKTTNYADNAMSVRAALVALVNRAMQDDDVDRVDWSKFEIVTGEVETSGPVPLRTMTLLVPFAEVAS